VAETRLDDGVLSRARHSPSVAADGERPADPGADAIEHYDRCARHSDTAMVIATVAVGPERAGCLVGFHTQASIDPRRHLVYISQQNHTHRLVTAATHMGVHFLVEGQHELARLFGGETGDAVDKFSACEWLRGPHDVPMLTAVANRFIGAVVERVHGGDHDGFLLEPVAAWSVADDEWAGREPLRFHDVADLDAGHEP